MDAVNPADASNAWSFIDLALLIGLALSVIVGAWRGLVHEVMSLLGWGAAYVSAQWFGPAVAPYLPVGEPGGRLNLISGMLVATLVNMTPLAQWGPWQSSRGVAWLAVLLDGLRPVLPGQVVKFLPEQS